MIKRLFLLFVIAVLAFAGVLVGRTLMYTSQQTAVAPAPELAVDGPAAAQRLAKALTFKTISYQDHAEIDTTQFEGLHAYLEAAYPKAHAAMEREIVSGFSLLYTWKGSDASLKPIVLLAHQDVVPVIPGTETDWEQPPFDGVVADGFVWGRGALDDKMSITSELEAIELFAAKGEKPKRTVYLFMGHDEEIGGEQGAHFGAALLKERGVEAEFVLDEGMAILEGVMPGIEKPIGLIGVAEKGYASLSMEVEAEGGHSSQPPRETAIGILANAVRKVEGNPMPAGIAGPARDLFDALGPEMPFGMRLVLANLWLTAPLVQAQLGGAPEINALLRTTTAPTLFNAGIKDNVLPIRASAVINFRLLPGDTIASVTAHVKRVVNDERVIVSVMQGAKEPSAVSPSDSDAFGVIAKTIREIMPGAVIAPGLVLGGTDSRHFEIVSPNVLRFGPERLSSEDLKRIHGTNERIGVEDYVRMIRFFHRLLENVAM